MQRNMRAQLPKKVQMLELLCRDGMQNLLEIIPTETKVWFLEQFIKAGYTIVEVCNFGHPRLLPQSRDAEDVLKRVWQLQAVKQGEVHLKTYGMTRKAFERAAEAKQKGYGPHSVAFTISAEDLHGRRNSQRTREEYFKEIPAMVKIAGENGFDIDMAIACVYGSPCAGPVPITNTIELIERGSTWESDGSLRAIRPASPTHSGLTSIWEPWSINLATTMMISDSGSLTSMIPGAWHWPITWQPFRPEQILWRPRWGK